MSNELALAKALGSDYKIDMKNATAVPLASVTEIASAISTLMTDSGNTWTLGQGDTLKFIDGSGGGSAFDLSAVPSWTNNGEAGVHPDGTPRIIIYYSMYGYEVRIAMDGMMEWFLSLYMGTGMDGYSAMTGSTFNAGFGGLSEGQTINFQTGTTVGESSDGYNFDLPMIIMGANGGTGINVGALAYNSGDPAPMISFQIPAGSIASGTSYKDALMQYFWFSGQSPPSGYSGYMSNKGFGLGGGAGAPVLSLGSVGADLSAYANDTYINTHITNIKNSAPTSLDSVEELANALGSDSVVSDFVAWIPKQTTTTFKGDGVTTDFVIPHDSGNVDVFVNGVLMIPELMDSSSGATSVLASGYEYQSLVSEVAGGGDAFDYDNAGLSSNWNTQPNGSTRLVIYYSMYGMEVSVHFDNMYTFEDYLVLYMGQGNDGYSVMTTSNFNAGFGGTGANSNIQHQDVIKFQTGTTVGNADDGWNWNLEMSAEHWENTHPTAQGPAYNDGSNASYITLKIPSGSIANGTSYKDAFKQMFYLGGQSPPSGYSGYLTNKGFSLETVGGAPVKVFSSTSGESCPKVTFSSAPENNAVIAIRTY
tara:strand:+ start:2076 stop:3848 length:1773 start_codon:yes stop_codon:yes gene_type:complete